MTSSSSIASAVVVPLQGLQEHVGEQGRGDAQAEQDVAGQVEGRVEGRRAGVQLHVVY